METPSASHAAYKAGESLGDIIVSPARLLIDTVTLQDRPIAGTMDRVRGDLWNIFMMPFRVAGHTALATAKTAGKLALNTALSTPLIPIETREIVSNTRKKLHSLSREVINYKLIDGQSPTEALGTA